MAADGLAAVRTMLNRPGALLADQQPLSGRDVRAAEPAVACVAVRPLDRRLRGRHGRGRRPRVAVGVGGAAGAQGDPAAGGLAGQAGSSADPLAAAGARARVPVHDVAVPAGLRRLVAGCAATPLGDVQAVALAERDARGTEPAAAVL